MSDNVESLMLEHFRRMASKLDAIALDIVDMKNRLTSVEEGQAAIRGDIVHLHTLYANQSKRIDRIDERLGRIERRLDLVEEPHS